MESASDTVTTLIVMSTSQDHKKLKMQLFNRFIPHKRRASPSSQHTTNGPDDPPTGGSGPLPDSSTQETSSRVDLDPPKDPTGIDYNPQLFTPRPSSKPNQTDPSSELPSQVEETFAIFPKFRILVVGNSGVGKSTLLSSVFNIKQPKNEDGTGIDIGHGRAGRADINFEHYSDENPHFIFHDSMGFEPGSTEKSTVVESFLQERSERYAKLPDQVHAIWHCIETPRSGSRLLQTADEVLLDLAKKLKIPAIVVFTKYDILFNEHYRDCLHIKSETDRRKEAENRAQIAYSKRTKELIGKYPFVRVQVLTHKDSTRKATQERKEQEGEMLVELTNVTRANLRDGSLLALWATAQQINPRQMIDISIREGRKKYWLNLDESVSFDGHLLVDCIARIRDDILKIWNFYDPKKVLSGEEFKERMIELVEPLAAMSRSDEEVTWNQPVDNTAGLAAEMVTVATAVSSGLIRPTQGTTMAHKFLESKYQKGVLTAIFLAAYIVDLILVLYEISRVTVEKLDPLKSLSREIVMDVLNKYKSRSSRIHAKLEVALPLNLEKIESVIRDALQSGGGTQTLGTGTTVVFALNSLPFLLILFVDYYPLDPRFSEYNSHQTNSD